MIFEITPEQIQRLSDGDLRDLVGRLCEADMVCAGHSTAGVTYGGDQNAADGGIDVRVETVALAEGGYVPRSITGFQVKAEDMPKAKIEAEIRPGGALRDSIAALAAAGGAYVIVSSKGSVADRPLAERRKAMRDALAGCPDGGRLHVDFYDRQRLASWANGHPEVISWVRERAGEPLRGWRPFGDWSSSPLDPAAGYLLDGSVRLARVREDGGSSLDVTAGLEAMRAALSRPRGVVRLVGLSGVGKTRLVQALFDPEVGADALSPNLVVYADLVDGPDPAPQELLGRLETLGRRCVLVVDNCGPDLHDRLSKRIARMNVPLSLMTVEYDIRDDEPDATEVWRLEPASAEVLGKVVSRHHPALTRPEIERIVEFSEGNARIALALANAARHCGSLANLKDGDLFERLFTQRNHPDPDLLRAAKAISLVYSFEGETMTGDEAELPILARLANAPAGDLYGRVAELHRRQLVQKRSRWRALLPHALAHRLARLALEDIPPSLVRTVLEHESSERLLRSFSRRLGDLHDSPQARAIVLRWLAPEGYLERVECLNEFGLALLTNVAPVDPEGVLDAIERASARDPVAMTADHGRVRTATRLLRSFAYDADLFDRATTLIGLLARDAEKTNNMSDPINVFGSLFHLHLSGTHALPQQRADLLRHLAARGDTSSRRLALFGLDSMLKCDFFSSSSGFEFGARRRDYGYWPRSRDDVSDWFATAFRLCEDLAAHLDCREEVRKTLARHFRQLSQRTAASGGLVRLVQAFAADGRWPEVWAEVRMAERRLRKKGRLEEAEVIATLAEDLKPRSLRERIAALVATGLDVLNILDGEDSTTEGISRAMERQTERSREIGRELAADSEVFTENLGTLMTANAPTLRDVARETAACVADVRTAWGAIVAEMRNEPSSMAFSSFPGWFLGGVASRDPALAVEILDEAMGIEALHGAFVHMQVNVGFAGDAFVRLLWGARMSSVPVWGFRMLPISRSGDGLGPREMRDLLLAIADRDGGVAVALEILRMRLHGIRSDGQEPSPEERETGVLFLDRVVFARDKVGGHRGLAEIVAGCFVPGQDDAVARRVVRRLRDALVAYEAYVWDYAEMADAFARLFPEAVLDVLVGDPGENWHAMLGWRSRDEDGHSLLRAVDPAVMVRWAGRDPGQRFAVLAAVVSPWARCDGGNEDVDTGLTTTLTWSPSARSLFEAAPDRLTLLRVLRGRFHPTSFSGSEAAALASRMPLLDELRGDPDPAVAAWAATESEVLREEVERQRTREATEDRARDERFE